MKHSREAVDEVDLDAPLPTLDKTQNFTTKRDHVHYSLPDKKNVVFTTNVSRPKAVTLLRTGQAIDFEYRENALRLEVPTAMRTSLPDMVKIVFTKQ